MSRPRAVPYIRKNLRLENTQGSLQSSITGSNRGSVMVWAAISSYSVGPIITLHGRITAREYVDSLGNQVHPMIQMLFPNDTVFQGDNAPIHTTGELFSHGLKSMKVNFNIFPGQHNHHI
jgi:hypothetical protein